MRRRFVTEQWLPFPRVGVFGFFADPRNLPPLMPGWQRARIEEVMLVPPAGRPEGRGGVFAGDGTRLLITARAVPGFLGVPVRVPWLARIEDFRWDEGFCDVQDAGPFRYWRHCHSVRDEARGGVMGTAVRDEVCYELPVPFVPGWMGDGAMRAMFGVRQRRAAGLVGRFLADTASS